MSITLERPAKKGKSVIGNPGLPQVNLLPPEVRAARGLVNVKRWLGLALVGVVVIAVLVYGYAVLSVHSANKELADAQSDAARLQQEQAKYAEVPTVLSNLKRVDDAREQGMSTEIVWKPYIDAIAAKLPPSVSIDTFTVTQATPWLASTASTEPLVPAGAATIVFTARASTLPDSAAWLDALDAIPGFSGATFTSAAVTQTDGPPYYAVSSSVQVADSAFALRFVQTPGGK